MLPCVKREHLTILSATADEKFLYGEDLFLRTHYPVTMKRFQFNEAVSWTEDDLLRELISGHKNLKGNRTFVLYGAPGSGKSEVIKWLECQIGKTHQSSFTLRVSRTELDPVRILQKMLSSFRGVGLDDVIHHQWDDLRKKPVTLANRLVWSALERMFSHDAEIIPISYRLRPIIEKNLCLNFEAIDNPRKVGRTPDLISTEQLTELAGEYFENPDHDCERLRSLMTRELEQAILGEYEFVETFKTISHEVVRKNGVRPVLLVDDLVQSMSIYATDLLDFLVTLEEGNWDTVLGLTPAAFESGKRGRELLNRITNLDTFDDRLTKLWLSDDQGRESYFVNVENCHLLAERYLVEIKRLAGYNCDTRCSAAHGCVALQLGMSDSPILSPLNPALLRRLFRALPESKGKARYFVGALSTVLGRMCDGNLATALEGLVKREVSVEHPEMTVRLLAEAYAPETVADEGVVHIPGEALSILIGNTDLDIQDLRARVSSLFTAKVRTTSTCSAELLNPELDCGRTAIRDWLEGKQVNKELLKGLRLGVAHVCRELTQPCNLIRPNTARQTSVAKWEETVEGSTVPVVLEGIDRFDGIVVPRSIGHVAYSLNYVHLKRGTSRKSALAEILSCPSVQGIVREARRLKARYVARLEGELGLKLDEFAFLLFIILMETGQAGAEIPASIQDLYPERRTGYPQGMADSNVHLSEELVQVIRSLFKDWLLLRENVYDASRLLEIIKKYHNVDPLVIIGELNPTTISHQFRIGSFQLGRFITNVQQITTRLSSTVRGEQALAERGRLERVLGLLAQLQHPSMYSEIASRLTQLGSNLDLEQPVIPDWQTCCRLQKVLRRKLGAYLRGNESLVIGSPIAAHRFLLILGEIDNDPSYRALVKLTEFMYEIICQMKTLSSQFRLDVQNNRLAGYFQLDWLVISPAEQPQECFKDTLAFLTEASTYMNRLRRYQQQLELTKLTAPFIDHQLADDARILINLVEECQRLGLPNHLMGRLEAVAAAGNTYRIALESVTRVSVDEGDDHHVVSTLVRSYQDLHTPGLIRLLYSICTGWLSYARAMTILFDSLDAKIDADYRGICSTLEQVHDVDQVGDLVQVLLKAASKLSVLPTITDVVGDLLDLPDDCSWLMDVLTKPDGWEVTLADLSFDQLQRVITGIPALARTVKVKLSI